MFISLAFNALPPVSCCNSGLTCILHIDDATFADGRSAPCIYFRSINIYGRTKWNVLRGYGTEGTEEWVHYKFVGWMSEGTAQINDVSFWWHFISSVRARNNKMSRRTITSNRLFLFLPLIAEKRRNHRSRSHAGDDDGVVRVFCPRTLENCLSISPSTNCGNSKNRLCSSSHLSHTPQSAGEFLPHTHHSYGSIFCTQKRDSSRRVSVSEREKKIYTRKSSSLDFAPFIVCFVRAI